MAVRELCGHRANPEVMSIALRCGPGANRFLGSRAFGVIFGVTFSDS